MGTATRRLVLFTCLLFTIGLYDPAFGQTWYGSAGLTLSGGSQTNLYLDPVLSTWNTDLDPEFGAVTPRAGLTFDNDRVRLSLTGRARFHPRRTENPQLSQGNLHLRIRLAPSWSVGLLGGGQRYRFPNRQSPLTTARDTWWALPSIRWTPTSETMISLQGGLTQRFDRTFDVTDRQTSGLASLRVSHWFTNRVQAEVGGYISNGNTSLANTDFGSVGGSFSLTYWPSSAVSLEGTLSFEQPQFDTLRTRGTTQQSGTVTETVRDQIGRVGLELKWRATSSISLFGRAEGLTADLEADESTSDLHVSAGVRLSLHGALGGESDSGLSDVGRTRRRVCEPMDDGVRIRRRYNGAGTVYVTGDFNGWSLPGIPLENNGDGVWTRHLELPTGRYEYRFRVVDAGKERWLDLPSHARTTVDAFGSTNGICNISETE